MKYRRGSKRWMERKNRVTITQRVQALRSMGLFGIGRAEYALWKGETEPLLLTKEMMERAVETARATGCDLRLSDIVWVDEHPDLTTETLSDIVWVDEVYKGDNK